MSFRRRTAAVLVLLAAGLVAAGCGRRGDPQFLPEGEPEAGSGFALPKKTEPAKPQTPFLLDPLLGPRRQAPAPQ